jgi:hypothetical protein
MKIAKNKRLYFLLGLASVIAGFLGKIFYRPFIYSNHIYDLGIADSLPSLFYVIGFSFLLFINQVVKAYLIITIVTIGSILYECFQFWRTDIFDLSDVFFSILGGIIATSIYLILKRKTGYKKN